MDDLKRKAEELLTRAGLGEPFGPVSVPEAARMCEAFSAGASLEAIAEGLQRSVETVRDTLEKFRPSMEPARKRLEAGALPAADRWAQLAATGKDYRAAKDLLLHTGVIEPIDDGAAGRHHNLVVVLGGPLPFPFKTDNTAQIDPTLADDVRGNGTPAESQRN